MVNSDVTISTFQFADHFINFITEALTVIVVPASSGEGHSFKYKMRSNKAYREYERFGVHSQKLCAGFGGITTIINQVDNW